MKKDVASWIAPLMVFALLFGPAPAYPDRTGEGVFSLDDVKGSEKMRLSTQAGRLLRQNGFVVTPGNADEISDLYIECKKRSQPIFVTTDAVLHTSHIFFDYVLRILEIEELYGMVKILTNKMLELSIQQHQEALDSEIKEAARLNIGFFAVAKKLFTPEYRAKYGLEKLIREELKNIKAHKGFKFRKLLSYVREPNLSTTPYAYEDYSQYVPRGHYTRNEIFQQYFKMMMWYGRIDFKLRPGKDKAALACGRKMTLQALLMVDALMREQKIYKMWQSIYEPTVYFVGKTDDLDVNDYMRLVKEIFPPGGTVDKYNKSARLTAFIEAAMKLRAPRILSGAALVEEGEFADTTRGFRFMGQRFIPDSYIFQELVFGTKNSRPILEYTGKGRPFTMEVDPVAGPVRAFPRGLDICAVLGSERALDILREAGDTDYTYYDSQMSILREEFSSRSEAGWSRNLYWRWLYSLLPLLEERKAEKAPRFMQTVAWLDKELQTVLGSWTELRHDTILYAKQSYPIVATAIPLQPERTLGYVEPYPQVYKRIAKTMKDLRNMLLSLQIAPGEIVDKIKEFEGLLAVLESISEKELHGQLLNSDEYDLILNIGKKLASLKRFPTEIMEKITSGTDEKMDLVADVHTAPTSGKVLEEAVGPPFNIYVIVDDSHGRRLCRGAVFSYYEFKHPMGDRLTDEKWQQMGKEDKRPPQPDWVSSFTAHQAYSPKAQSETSLSQ